MYTLKYAMDEKYHYSIDSFSNSLAHGAGIEGLFDSE